MGTLNSPGQQEKPRPKGALRPFLWSGLLILVLFSIRLHQRLMSETFIAFNVAFEGQSITSGFEARCDGQSIYSVQPIQLGTHRLTVTHPKGVSFATNFFAFYG